MSDFDIIIDGDAQASAEESATLAATSAANAATSAEIAKANQLVAAETAAGVQEILQSDKTYTTAINQLSLEESTGYGVISGGSATVSGLVVTIAAVISHMPNGNRYSLPQSTITVNAADATNPRVDLIYLSSAGVVSYLEGTAAVSPTVPSVPAGGLALWSLLLATDGTITLTDLRFFKQAYIYSDGTVDMTATLSAYNVDKPLVFNGLVLIDGTLSLGRCAFLPGSKIVLGASASVTITEIQDTTQQIFDVSLGGTVVIKQAFVRPDWWGDIENSVLKAIAALPSTGGEVRLLNKRYKPNATTYNTNYISKANITIRGTKMPTYSSDLSKLINGSIIEGRFNVYADYFHHENVGYDCGKYVVATYYGGVDTTNSSYSLNGGTWDAFAFAEPTLSETSGWKVGYQAHNVIGLCAHPNSIGHSMLQEAITYADLDNVVAIHGVHGIVLKGSHITAGILKSFCTGWNGMIIKSDGGTGTAYISISQHIHHTEAPSTQPWYGDPIVCLQGLNIDPGTSGLIGNISIGQLKVYGAVKGLLMTCSVATAYITDIQISELFFDGISYTTVMDWAIVAADCNLQRIQFGNIIMNNVNNGVYLGSNYAGVQYFSINKLFGNGITNNALCLVGYAKCNSSYVSLRTVGGYAYYIGDNARLIVGGEEAVSSINKWALNAPALSTGWSDVGSGNDTFGIRLMGNKVVMQGLIKPALSSTNSIVATIPSYLRPTMTKRFVTCGSNGTVSAVPVQITSDGNIIVNEGTGVTNCTAFLSLNGIEWDLYS